jgi:hypothetical protein
MKCQWYRFRINRHIDNDPPMSKRTRAHMRLCQQCDFFHREQTEFCRALNSTTDHLISPSPFLRDWILNRITREDRVPAHALNWPRSAAGGLVAVVVAMTFIMVAFRQGPPPPKTARVQLVPKWIDLTAEATSGENLFRVTINLNQPLQKEMELDTQDAQAVLNSLANDFVPSGLMASNR